jgi:hypothetical protein
MDPSCSDINKANSKSSFPNDKDLILEINKNKDKIRGTENE